MILLGITTSLKETSLPTLLGNSVILSSNPFPSRVTEFVDCVLDSSSALFILSTIKSFSSLNFDPIKFAPF